MGQLIDRRGHVRGSMFAQRRRYPRVFVPADVYYESDERALFSDAADLSLRGLFIPCRAGDSEHTQAVVRIDAGPGALVKASVEVVSGLGVGRAGMALRFRGIGAAELDRIARLLMRHGGLAALPQLDRRFELLARLPAHLVRLAA